VFKHLQIPYRQERMLVGLADAGLRTARLFGWPHTARASTSPPERILILRLERIGDLLMVVDPISSIRSLAPQARIDLVVGSWNRALAQLIPGINAVETLDVPWMAREGAGDAWRALVQRAREWRDRGYDLAINFEPDIRSNLLLALSGASRRVGFDSGGGGAVLTDAIAPDPRAHIAVNAAALVEHAFGQKPAGKVPHVGLNIPEEARRKAATLVASAGDRALVGIQPAAGRRVKEWDPVRFAEVGAELARSGRASVMLVGSAGDKPVVDAVRAAWPAGVPLLELPPETDLVVLAAVLERFKLLITGDTGPMHLAAAVGTPILAIFGPSLPSRYAPLSPRSKIVRIDIHCSPCNLMRKPPERCVGVIPDCLAGISTASVLRAAEEMLRV
jgi:lipopolysaccharide heptosyltransferase II